MPGRRAGPGRTHAPSDGVNALSDNALLDIMKNAASLGVKGRYKKLEPVILGTFDVPYMTKVSVGSLWSTLPPEQKQRAWTAFGRFITATYAKQFDGYSGEDFKILGEQKVHHGMVIRTQLVKSDGEPIALNYLVHDNDIGWQIRDVYLTRLDQPGWRHGARNSPGQLQNGGIGKPDHDAQQEG